MGGHFPADGTMVSSEFFRTLGIPLLAGREFDDIEDQNHPRVAILSRNLADRLFPNGEAVGKSIRFGFMPDFQNIQIVGIAANARISNLRDAAPPVIYFSYLQGFEQWGDVRYGDLFVRTSGPPGALAKMVGTEIESLGHEYALETKTILQTSGA